MPLLVYVHGQRWQLIIRYMGHQLFQYLLIFYGLLLHLLVKRLIYLLYPITCQKLSVAIIFWKMLASLRAPESRFAGRWRHDAMTRQLCQCRAACRLHYRIILSTSSIHWKTTLLLDTETYVLLDNWRRHKLFSRGGRTHVIYIIRFKPNSQNVGGLY